MVRESRGISTVAMLCSTSTVPYWASESTRVYRGSSRNCSSLEPMLPMAKTMVFLIREPVLLMADHLLQIGFALLPLGPELFADRAVVDGFVHPLQLRRIICQTVGQ